MQLSGNTILITGGGTGIGLALAERFIGDGNTVIICGRREEALKSAKQRYPDLIVHTCDVADAEQRTELHRWALREHPGLNVLVNNAGIQRRLDLLQSQAWKDMHDEIAINLEAPVHLSCLFADHLRTAKAPAIITIGSGLAFVPMASAPVYCATKAALHSFTLSLRHQLARTAIQVIEICPPAVNTDLGGSGLHSRGTPLEEFASAAYERLKAGDLEFGYGFSEKTRNASRAELDETFKRMNPPSTFPAG
jgi:uncharacterized oxidoreductase